MLRLANNSRDVLKLASHICRPQMLQREEQSRERLVGKSLQKDQD